VTTLSTFNNLNQILGSEIEGADDSSEGSTHIRGRVVDKNVESVTVNGILAVIEGETYTVEDLTLQPGENAVVVEATDKAGNETVETFTLFFDPRARATYRYDLNGNLIQKTEKGVAWRYEWDAENRLIRVRKATTEGAESTEIEYAYYDNGNRAWKRVTEPGQEPVVTHYVHDGIHVIAEYNGEGTLLKEYVYSGNIDEVLNIRDGTENLFLHQDGLNSVVAVTDASGERIASFNYEAFGTIKDATGALGNPITYTGRWIEPETGDYFYRARYYDAGIGRFLKRDPIGFNNNDFYNIYRYVRNNPNRYIDSLGLWCIPWFSLKLKWKLVKGPYNKKWKGHTLTQDAGGGVTIWRRWAYFDYVRTLILRYLCYECNPETNRIELFYKFMGYDKEYKTEKKVIESKRTRGINIGGFHYTTDPNGNPVVQEKFDPNRF
jgi:RHS repeat-associated protein